MALFGSVGRKDNLKLGLKRRVALSFSVLVAVLAAGTPVTATVFPTPASRLLFLLGTGLVLAVLLTLWTLQPFKHALHVFDTVLKSFEDGDFGMRLAPPAQPELRELVTFFNRVTELSQEARRTAYQKELLLDTVIQSAPMAILLLGPNRRLILANKDAHRLFPLKKTLVGMKLEELAAGAAPEVKAVLAQSHDALFTLTVDGEPETFHFAKRGFSLNTMPHQLIMIKHLTKELGRREVETWKKLIRLFNHELNNTLAPIRSLLHSARLILEQPHQYHKLDRILETMERTTDRLHHFLEDYASFARLPMPQKETVCWSAFLEGVRALMPFELHSELKSDEGYFDPGQIQQVIINLVKNGYEATADGAPVELFLANTAEGGTSFQVMDRGQGLSEDALQRVLLPFYSSKKTGTGLGLPLCREILESHGGSIRLQPREGGGLKVECWLPPR